jgi:hypothetical protein
MSEQTPRRWMSFVVAAAGLAFLTGEAGAQESQTRFAPNQPAKWMPMPSRPYPDEIPVPEIPSPYGHLPGPDQLPSHPEMPDLLTMNDGTKITTKEQWPQRREEIKKTLEYYSVGTAPPPPGNVVGKEISSQLLLDGKFKYRLIHLTFGPQDGLSLDFGIATPTASGPMPVVIALAGSPPGSTAQIPRLSPGALDRAGDGRDVLMVVGPTTQPAGGRGGFGRGRGSTTGPGAPAGFGRGGGGPQSLLNGVMSGGILQHGFAYITFDPNQCAADSTLRMSDGSWAFRTVGFFPAYPGYDWGVLRGWAWGVSRIVDYLQSDPSIDKEKIVVTGVSRDGKGAMVAAAFDERIAMAAPIASSGGGVPAYRFSGVGRGGKEGLTEMEGKYPNYWTTHLHEFWGQQDKLPFDEHFYPAMVLPRPFIALEGTRDQNVVAYGVKMTITSAQPAYDLFGISDKIGVSWADRMHGVNAQDIDALLAFADKHLLGKPIDRKFDEYPPTAVPVSANP